MRVVCVGDGRLAAPGDSGWGIGEPDRLAPGFELLAGLGRTCGPVGC